MLGHAICLSLLLSTAVLHGARGHDAGMQRLLENMNSLTNPSHVPPAWPGLAHITPVSMLTPVTVHLHVFL